MANEKFFDKEKFEEFKAKYWPKTKEEIEKGMDQTRKLIKEGEKHVRDFSQKSAKQAKKISLILKREKLFYELGKTVALTPKTRWNEAEEIAKTVGTIKDLTKEIKGIK